MSIQTFIEKQGFRPDYSFFKEGVDRFVAEMESGLAGKPSSLKMLPTYIRLGQPPEAGQKAIVIDAGGTNLRIALVRFNPAGAPEMLHFQKHPMPGTQGELSCRGFFDALAMHLAPIAAESNRIGFCFSFPFEPLPSGDGRILNFNKEVHIADAAGEIIGQGLLDALQRHGLAHNHSVCVINDTVATLLGGQALAAGREFQSFIGFILGTGTNTCYVEKNALITKNDHLCNQLGESLVNLESGGYACMPRTAIDNTFDRNTKTPGTQLLEKMVSGAYQGSLLMAFIRGAAAEGCFSEVFAARLEQLQQLDSKDVDAFVLHPHGDNALAALAAGNEDDLQSLRALTDAFFERAAMLVAINLTAVLQKTGAGRNPCYPVCISAEGTTFHRSILLGQKLTYFMTHFAQKKEQLYFEILHGENTTISGTAIAGLTQK